MNHTIDISDALSSSLPVIDVRSPGEFEKGHIPGAVNIPLFSDDERAHIGTVYKQRSPEEAAQIGREYVEPKREDLLNRSRTVAPDGNVLVHCWRGGDRSAAFTSELQKNDFEGAKQITGGYKAYRNFVQQSFKETFHLKVLGGYTGSGKTHILHEMNKDGSQIIDLEGLANHKGSAFGGIGQGEQPSTEHFENLLFTELSGLDHTLPIWVEDESMNIGSVQIPNPFFAQMQDSMLYFIEIPKEARVDHLVSEYAEFSNAKLADSVDRISKRLGGLRRKKALNSLQDEDYHEGAGIALKYYDKLYLKGMKKRANKEVIKIPLPDTDHQQNALIIKKTSLEHV